MGLFDKFSSKKLSKQVTSNDLLKLLGNLNSDVKSISRKLEFKIFSGFIFNYDADDDREIPLAQQEIINQKYEEYNNRFIITAAIINLGVIEYTLIKRKLFDENILALQETKSEVFKNILTVRKNILKNSTLEEFDLDEEREIEYNKENLEAFSKVISDEALYVAYLIAQGGIYQNIYNHLYSQLGKVLPYSTSNPYSYPDSNFIDEKVAKLISLCDFYFTVNFPK